MFFSGLWVTNNKSNHKRSHLILSVYTRYSIYLTKKKKDKVGIANVEVFVRKKKNGKRIVNVSKKDSCSRGDAAVRSKIFFSDRNWTLSACHVALLEDTNIRFL